MKKPPHIDGVNRVCCGNKPQCEDCTMKLWDEMVEKEEAYRLAVKNRRSHPQTVTRLWEEYTEAWHRLKGVNN